MDQQHPHCIGRAHQRSALRRRTAAAAILLAAATLHTASAQSTPKIAAIGIENEYADVIAQIGGKYVQASSIVNDPNTDPHSFEASPKIAARVADAGLIVKNGAGYDAWADKLIAATTKPARRVIDVQKLLGLPADTPNPHLWYDPKTMPAVARAIAAGLSALQPAHKAYFEANLEAFDTSLKPWTAAIAAFKAKHDHTAVAATEPVANDLLQAMGFDIATPFALQAAIMNGTDPAPQDVTVQNGLFNGRKVRVFAYNQQVTGPLTTSFLDLAKKNGVPVVGVYETMPTRGYTYQSWMLAEVMALQKAVVDEASTETLETKP